MTDTALLFARLFEGRIDAVGGENGLCERVAEPTWEKHVQRIKKHLEGDPMGVYPLVYTPPDMWRVHWGCVDFDEGIEASWIHARNLHAMLQHLGVAAWIELSRSKGCHVWVFADAWVPAETMRHALWGVTDSVKAPTREVNPKQTMLRNTEGLGNYLRLPYPGGWEATGRRCMVDPADGSVIGTEEFLEAAWATRVTEPQLEELLTFYTPPKKPRPPIVPHTYEARTPSSGMGRLSRHIYTNGPKAGHDRSSTLWALANSLHEDGLPYGEALDYLYEADRAWGKHIASDNAIYLDRMCDKVWGR